LFGECRFFRDFARACRSARLPFDLLVKGTKQANDKTRENEMKATFIIIGRSAAWALVRVLLTGLLFANDGGSQDSDELVNAVAKARAPSFAHTMWQPAVGSLTHTGRTWARLSTSPFEAGGDNLSIVGKPLRGDGRLEELVPAARPEGNVGFDVLRPPWLR
jgi:hypothetical protein